MSSDLLHLPARDRSGALNVVVETPRGAGVKLKYSPELRAFVLSRPLPLGITYPFDWGFVPSTRAPDDDPLDATLLLDVASYPGVVVRCRPVAVLEVEQNAKGGGRERSDRIIAAPVSAPRSEGALSARVREELAAFFVSVTRFERKDVRILGWGEAGAADALIDSAREAA